MSCISLQDVCHSLFNVAWNMMVADIHIKTAHNSVWYLFLLWLLYIFLSIFFLSHQRMVHIPAHIVLRSLSGPELSRRLMTRNVRRYLRAH